MQPRPQKQLKMSWSLHMTELQPWDKLTVIKSPASASAEEFSDHKYSWSAAARWCHPVGASHMMMSSDVFALHAEATATIDQVQGNV